MAKNGSTAVITANNLGAAYRQRPVWQGADFEVKKGQFVAVLGPNGAGKTTLFRMILGLMRPAAGQLRVFGRSPKRGDSRIGYVPQRHGLDTDMRLEALEIVKLGLNGTHWGVSLETATDNNLALEALAQVDAEDLAH